MGMASASSAADTAINSTGGNLSINQPNYLAWMIAGIGLVLLAFVFKKRKKR